VNDHSPFLSLLQKKSIVLYSNLILQGEFLEIEFFWLRIRDPRG